MKRMGRALPQGGWSTKSKKDIWFKRHDLQHYKQPYQQINNQQNQRYPHRGDKDGEIDLREEGDYREKNGNVDNWQEKWGAFWPALRSPVGYFLIAVQNSSFDFGWILLLLKSNFA